MAGLRVRVPPVPPTGSSAAEARLIWDQEVASSILAFQTRQTGNCPGRDALPGKKRTALRVLWCKGLHAALWQRRFGFDSRHFPQFAQHLQVPRLTGKLTSPKRADQGSSPWEPASDSVAQSDQSARLRTGRLGVRLPRRPPFRFAHGALQRRFALGDRHFASSPSSRLLSLRVERSVELLDFFS